MSDTDTQTILASVSLALSVLGTIVLGWNHKRIRSACCGRIFSASLDIENTTPTKSVPPIDVRSPTPPA